jgi:6-phosphogluconolactonase (cycloisomerase 2 family)
MSPETIDSEEETKGQSAHIAVHPTGKWLYVSNRAENSVVCLTWARSHS